MIPISFKEHLFKQHCYIFLIFSQIFFVVCISDVPFNFVIVWCGLLAGVPWHFHIVMPYLDNQDIYDDIHNCALICKQHVFHCCNVLHRPKRSFVFSPSTSWLQLPYLCGAIQRTAWVRYVIGCIMKSHTEDFFLTHIFPTLFFYFFLFFLTHIFSLNKQHGYVT